jgi:hypothetical protein
MKRKIFLFALIALFAFAVASCEEELELTQIVFTGVEDVTLDFEEPFNIFDGVIAVGNDAVDYSDQITFLSTSPIDEEGNLDTTDTGEHAVRYEVRVDDVLAQHWRYITVNPPQAQEGEMLVNPNFDNGTAGWDDGANGFYVADGASLDLSVEEGALKAEVVAGSNTWTPRFGQQNVPFETGKTYEISFDAKSSVEKTINLQVGQLVPTDPYFIDFKPNQTEHHLITTEWATYSYKFTMNLENVLGGPLFELGTIGGVGIDATMWFDNIAITESTPDEDTTGPVINGLKETVNVTVGSTFDPMAGITAYDLTDGDVTDAIDVTITDSESNVVEEIDTSVEGTFTVTYYVKDSLDNETTETVTVNVVSLLFRDENLILNPSFEDALDPETPVWGVWSQDWGTAPVLDVNHDVENGELNVGITGGGDAAWAVQVFQEGLTLEEGVTYKVTFNAYASVVRDINLAVGYGDPWVEFARQDGITLGIESATYELVFTVTQETYDNVKVVFEMGNTPSFSDGTVTLEDVALQELDADPVVQNGSYDAVGWRAFANDWEGSVFTGMIVEGEFVMHLTTYNNTGANWTLQVIQDEVALGLSPSGDNGVLVLDPETTYTFSFDAYASEAITINPLIATPGVWANFIEAAGQSVAITTEKTTYTYSFTTPASLAGTEFLKFEFGQAFASFEDDDKWIAFDNIVITKPDETALESVYNGTMDQVLFHNYDNSGEVATGQMVAVDGDAVITVDTLGGNAWEPHYYYMIDSLDAGTYTVVLRMTSSVARDFRFNLVLPDAGHVSILPDTKVDFSADADVMTTVTVQFTLEAATTNIKVELDFGTLGDELVSVPGTFTLHELLIYQNIA